MDGLRAIAALAVLTYHAGFESRLNEASEGLGTLTARLNVGVTVFFLISGFLLYRPFVAARAGRGPAPSWRKFWRRRGLRIVPAYWVALTALAIFPGLVGVFTGDWWIYYGFLQQWQRSTIINGIPPAWTLGTELCFYAMLPLYAAAMIRLERRAPGGEIGVLAALSAGAIAFRVWIVSAGNHPQLATTIFGTFDWFAVGMLLAIASVRWEGRPLPGPIAALAARPWICWTVAAGAFFLLANGIGLPHAFVFAGVEETHAQVLGEHALSALVALGLLLPAVFRAGDRGGVRTFLLSRPVVALGVVSYGIYLFHDPIAIHLADTLDIQSRTASFLVILALTATLAIACAAVSYRWVERPFLRRK